MAEGLGSLAAWGGGVLVAGFVVFREAYPRIVRAGVKLPGTLYKSRSPFTRLPVYSSGWQASTTGTC